MIGHKDKAWDGGATVSPWATWRGEMGNTSSNCSEAAVSSEGDSRDGRAPATQKRRGKGWKIPVQQQGGVPPTAMGHRGSGGPPQGYHPPPPPPPPVYQDYAPDFPPPMAYPPPHSFIPPPSISYPFDQPSLIHPVDPPKGDPVEVKEEVKEKPKKAAVVQTPPVESFGQVSTWATWRSGIEGGGTKATTVP